MNTFFVVLVLFAVTFAGCGIDWNRVAGYGFVSESDFERRSNALFTSFRQLSDQFVDLNNKLVRLDALKDQPGAANARDLESLRGQVKELQQSTSDVAARLEQLRVTNEQKASPEVEKLRIHLVSLQKSLASLELRLDPRLKAVEQGFERLQKTVEAHSKRFDALESSTAAHDKTVEVPKSSSTTLAKRPAAEGFETCEISSFEGAKQVGGKVVRGYILTEDVRSSIKPCAARYKETAAPGTPIEVFGFADKESFYGVSAEESERLNAEVSKRRAISVKKGFDQELGTSIPSAKLDGLGSTEDFGIDPKRNRAVFVRWRKSEIVAPVVLPPGSVPSEEGSKTGICTSAPGLCPGSK